MTPRTKRPSPPDPDEARKSILKAITVADAPVSSAFLRSIPEIGRRLPATEIQKLLTEDLASGSVFNWATKSKPEFWNRDPKDVARERILEAASAEIPTRAELQKRVMARVPRLNKNVVQTVQTELILDGRLREVPGAKGPKLKRLINAARPEVYLAEAVAILLESFGLPRPLERIKALLAAEASKPAPESTPAGAEEQVRDTAEKIFSAMNRIAFSPGTTVTFYRLRQQPELAGIPKPTFDQAALLLQREHRALLSIHDHAAALPPEERDRFVTDGLGKYYVSIYAR